LSKGVSMGSQILIASDHGGIGLKAHVVKLLEKMGVSVKDLGTHSEKSVDYTDYAIKLGKQVGKNKDNKGILICKSGIGMAITANKVKGVRAALCVNKKMAKLSRLHNNSNVLVLGSLFVPKKNTKEILEAWLKASFEGGRHERRIKKITKFEGK